MIDMLHLMMFKGAGLALSTISVLSYRGNSVGYYLTQPQVEEGNKRLTFNELTFPK